MKRGDLAIYEHVLDKGRADEIVIVMDTDPSDDNWVQVLSPGGLHWVPKFTVSPVQPAADGGMIHSSTGGKNA